MTPVTRTQHSARDHSPGVHVIAGIDTPDDTLASDQGFTGLVIKQAAPGINTPRPDLALVKAGEKYFIWDCGEVDVVVPAGLAPAKGDRLYINPATNALSKNPADPTGLEKVGKVRYVGPERGLASDMMTVGFDARKDF